MPCCSGGRTRLGCRTSSAATSPYLRQHADNPVDWWEWSPEAFAESAATDRPVLRSVGYAACHWCHEVDRLAAVDGNLRNRRSAA
ncbi:MAG: DUF255 domain-containing protein [Nocardioides sp.]